MVVCVTAVSSASRNLNLPSIEAFIIITSWSVGKVKREILYSFQQSCFTMLFQSPAKAIVTVK